MINLSVASSRVGIDVAEVSEIARMARTADPGIISTDDMQSLLGQSALVLDGLRTRPRYFDGRFLTGVDFSRDQDYVRQRQNDLARATGTGVVAGLRVSLAGASGGQTLVIQPGHGITPSGDLVMVTSARAVPLLDLATSRQLDVTFGLSELPRVPLGRRTGLFVLALRPVEFTANPISAYPTCIDGPRQIQDGDVIEATSIDLIPYPEAGSVSLDDSRRAVARRLFLGASQGLPQDALPLAMIALDKGTVRWIDVDLVRRETGADTPLQVSMAARPRALSEAFVLQHRQHLADVLADRARAGLSPAFAAAQYFAALPAAGQLPAASILPDNLGFRQMWFPPSVDVDVSFVPADEIAALVEESLALPPIDLLADPADLDATGVVVLAPVARSMLQRFEAALAALSQPARADPSQGLRRVPSQLLAQLVSRQIRLPQIAPAAPPALAANAQAQQQTQLWQTSWAEAVAAIAPDASGVPLLWYVRRRAVAYDSQLIGLAVEAGDGDEALMLSVDARLQTLGLTVKLKDVASRATPFAVARIYALLGLPRIAASTVLTASVVHDLAVAAPPADPVAPNPPQRLILPRPGVQLPALQPNSAHLLEGDVIEIANRYGAPDAGDGLTALFAAQSADPLDNNAQLWIGGTGLAPDLDQAALHLEGDALTQFAASVRTLARKADDASATALKTLIADAPGS
ncbi:hypothetical protein [Paraburkholderia atlantica]|uniref:hypothetical protein n=1 Tax=Paraburkholderia atlantica TaxID=2654982 RepID=UPI003D21CD99